MINFKVNADLCNLCGLCAADCPVSIIKLEENGPVIHKEESCIHCQHCLAICPHGAISILDIDPQDSIPLVGNFPQAKQMETLIKGRRSVRAYIDRNVEPKKIRQLVETAWHAPTGRNMQPVKLLVVDQKETIQVLRDEIYEKLPAVLETLEAPETNRVWLVKYLKWSLKMWTKRGIDPIFSSAPHFVVAAIPDETGTTVDIDAAICLSYFELMAHAMGLGTLWNGILTWTLQLLFPDISKRLGLPEGYKIGYVIMFGFPKRKYSRTVQRTPVDVNYVSLN